MHCKLTTGYHVSHSLQIQKAFQQADHVTDRQSCEQGLEISSRPMPKCVVTDTTSCLSARLYILLCKCKLAQLKSRISTSISIITDVSGPEYRCVRSLMLRLHLASICQSRVSGLMVAAGGKMSLYLSLLVSNQQGALILPRFCSANTSNLDDLLGFWGVT